ncbi:MAG: AAA family ATPase [PVC group bacterium]|nr:AAA family ATPase [PVC group bacterium]
MLEYIEINKDFEEAFDLIENSNECVFVTGKAGTGKSTFLRYLKKNTGKNAVVLAPTGLAAINVRGQTIHSFFKFPPKFIDKQDIKKLRRKKLFKKIEMVIIDEISMVRADLMDGIDHALRLNRGFDVPFGGAQVVMFGDLFQLPPVIRGRELNEFFAQNYGSAYFFSAKVFSEISLRYVELSKIYRQSDSEFINLLDRVRNKNLLPQDLNFLNQRVVRQKNIDDEDVAITLTTTNAIAAKVNEYHLNKLEANEYQYQAEISDKFGESFFPTEFDLKLKVGAQVMMLMNDPERRWVNGSIGVIMELSGDFIKVQIDEDMYEIPRMTWHNIKYRFDKEQDAVIEEVEGTFMQYPIKLAWAITIHKSQGKTFDRVVINLGAGAFTHGQVYVALSRCSSLEGISLTRPVWPRDVIFDKKIYEFRERVKNC